MSCVTGDLIAGECQVPGAETTTLNYNEEPAHLAPLSSLPLQSPAAVMDPEMGTSYNRRTGPICHQATLTTATTATDKYFLEHSPAEAKPLKKIHRIIDPVKTKNSHSYTLTL